MKEHSVRKPLSHAGASYVFACLPSDGGEYDHSRAKYTYMSYKRMIVSYMAI